MKGNTTDKSHSDRDESAYVDMQRHGLEHEGFPLALKDGVSRQLEVRKQNLLEKRKQEMLGH